MSEYADPREELIDRLRPLALALVGAVRDDGPEAVQAIVDGIPGAPIPPEGVAMMVLLAAMVDEAKTPGELLGWTDMRLPTPEEAERRRLRELGLADELATTLVQNLAARTGHPVDAETLANNPYLADSRAAKLALKARRERERNAAARAAGKQRRPHRKTRVEADMPDSQTA